MTHTLSFQLKGIRGACLCVFVFVQTVTEIQATFLRTLNECM